MSVGIHQPCYLPWEGFFNKMMNVDTFVLLDDVQFSRGQFINRNRVRNRDGWLWLTIPVGKHLSTRIDHVYVTNPYWKKKHYKTLEANYGKSQYWDDYKKELEILYKTRYHSLLQVDVIFMEFMTRILSIDVDIVFSSSILARDDKELRILDICTELGTDQYLSGEGARAYMPEGIEGLDVHFQEYRPEVKNPLSAIDSILTIGAKETRKKIKEGYVWK